MKYIDEDTATQMFNDLIDEISQPIVILGMTYCPSRVLHEIDPVAYDCELANWLDGEELTTEPDPCHRCGEHMDEVLHTDNEHELLCIECHDEWLSNLE